MNAVQQLAAKIQNALARQDYFRALALIDEHAAATKKAEATTPPPQNKLYAISLVGISHVRPVDGKGRTRMWSALVTAETPDEAVEHFKGETREGYSSYEFIGSTAQEITNEHIDKINASNGHTL